MATDEDNIPLHNICRHCFTKANITMIKSIAINLQRSPYLRLQFAMQKLVII